MSDRNDLEKVIKAAKEQYRNMDPKEIAEIEARFERALQRAEDILKGRREPFFTP